MSYQKRFAIVFATAALLSEGAKAQSVSPTAPAPTTTLAAPGPQKHQPQQQRQQQLPGATAPQPILLTPGKGSVEGFVYWDAQKITHKPAGSCNGLAITVSVGSNSGGPLTAYSSMGNLQAVMDKLQESIHHPDGPFRASFKKSGSDGFSYACVAEISANSITGQQIDKRQGRQGQQDALRRNHHQEVSPQQRAPIARSPNAHG